MAAESNGHKRFDIPIRTAKLVFEGEYDGAEVRCRLDLPLALFLEIAEMSDSVEVSRIRQYFERFNAEALLDWNLSIEGEPIAAHPDGMLKIPLAMANAIITAWANAIKESPLAQASARSGS